MSAILWEACTRHPLAGEPPGIKWKSPCQACRRDWVFQLPRWLRDDDGNYRVITGMKFATDADGNLLINWTLREEDGAQR